MATETTLERIEREATALGPRDKLRLVERIVHQLGQADLGDKFDLDWDELYGAGKGLWEGEDAQDYVNRMREDRECP